jgi:ribosome maturation factor RimP
MKPVDLQALQDLLRPAVEGQDYELCELTWRREQGGYVLRLTIDRMPGQGYVSHDDCTRVSREVSALLDVHDVLPAAYSLEVSSPGIERPLKRSADFVRFVGQRVRVRMRPVAEPPPGPLVPHGPQAGTQGRPQRNFVGKIDSVAGEVVRLLDESSGPVELHIAEMEKANLSPSL